MNRPSRCDLYVLAGGQSSRFGSDKALANVDGRSMLASVIDPLQEALAPYRPAVTLVTGSSERYEDLGLRAITDQPAGIGPMGGLHAALQDLLARNGPGWLMLSGCDWVRLEPSWVRPLLARWEQGGSSVIAYHGQKWEPMLGLYHTALLPMIQRMIEAQHTSLQSLLNQADAMRIPADETGIEFRQANTPQQLALALKESARS